MRKILYLVRNFKVRVHPFVRCARAFYFYQGVLEIKQWFINWHYLTKTMGICYGK